ncbi:condensin-2 complex subunit G2-like [Babylonia areolata]|uniref:condensin-2 complex subunit G2-like n=1 Tax=Babylonia areolata TaxID=304850 RepID=UPI003FD6A97E
MSQRAELLALVQKEDTEAVVQFVKNAKQRSADLADTVAECSQRQREDLWESLRRACTDVLLDDKVEDDEAAEREKKSHHHAFLDCLVTLSAATVQQVGVSLPQAFVDTAALLHGVLPTLPDELDAVKHRLAQVFETWWKQNLPGREEVVANTFVYFLKRSLSKNTVSDIKSVWRLHSVLTLVNMEAASATDLKNLLGRCCAAAHYIKSDEGRRFLGYVFTVNTELVDCMHRAIKNHIPYAPKSWLALYGDVYLRAWQKSSGEICQKIENDCIQDLMNHAVHAGREGPQPMSSTLFRVMHQFHRQKKQRGVDAMLLRLYNPILWRALTVPNTELRANSASLLLDAFPLQDPNATAEDTDLLIQKQFDLMQRLLCDPCPVVRGLTVEGVCHVLGDYLEMIPGEVVHSLLCRLLKELAWDLASPSVRLAVFKGLCGMLDNPMCHMLLKPLLPGLSLCLHDKAETVRVAMLDLLLKVKGIRSIKYWTIAPIEHLLARLEGDSQPVVRRIVELLFPSFLPLDQGPQEQVSRCLTLLQSNAAAARVFFLHAPRHLTLSDTVKYMGLLCRYVLESVRSMKQSSDDNDDDDDDNDSSSKTRARGGKKRRDDVTQEESEEKSDDDDDNDNTEDDAMTQETLQGLLEVIFLMWTAVAKQLDLAEHADLKQSIMKKLSVTVPEVLKVTQDPKVISLVVEIAGHLPPKAVPTISRGCLTKLRTMPECSTEGDYAEILEAVCLWDMVPHLLQLLSDWLEDSLTPLAPQDTPTSLGPEKKATKGGKKCVRIAVPEAEKRPNLAVDYLSAMLRSAVCKRVLLSDHRASVVKLNKLLSRVMALVEQELEQGKADNSVRTFLETVLSLHLRLTVLLHDPDEEGGDSVAHVGEVMEWGGRRLVPIMLQAAGGSSDDDDDNDADNNDNTDSTGGEAKSGTAAKNHVELATACVLLMVNVSTNMLMLGMGEREQVRQLFTFCRQLLHKDTTLTVVEHVLGCLHQAVLFEELGVAEEVSRCMSEVMVTLNACLHRRRHHHRSVDAKVLTNVKNKLQGLVTCIISRHGNAQAGEGDVAIVTDLTSTMLSAVLAELQYGSQQDTLPTKLEEGEDALTPVATCVLTCYSRNTPCRRLFIQEMERCVKSGAVTDVHTVHAVVHLLGAVQCKAVYHKDVDMKSVITSVSEMVQRMSQQNPEDKDVDVDVYKDTMDTLQTKLQSIMGKTC